MSEPQRATGTDLVRLLLADQHPDLAARPIAFAGHGWDNDRYRLGDDLARSAPVRAGAPDDSPLIGPAPRTVGELAG